jgi:hypothetical protein
VDSGELKTDRELDKELAPYEKQVSLYASAISRSTGYPTSAILMRVCFANRIEMDYFGQVHAVSTADKASGSSRVPDPEFNSEVIDHLRREVKG